jgi:putative two-component system response regulator
VGTGDEALAAVADQDCALAIVDLSLPGADGREAGAQLRRDPRTCELPILFLIGDAGREAQRVEFRVPDRFDTRAFSCSRATRAS